MQAQNTFPNKKKIISPSTGGKWLVHATIGMFLLHWLLGVSRSLPMTLAQLACLSPSISCLSGALTQALPVSLPAWLTCYVPNPLI